AVGHDRALQGHLGAPPDLTIDLLLGRRGYGHRFAVAHVPEENLVGRPFGASDPQRRRVAEPVDVQHRPVVMRLVGRGHGRTINVSSWPVVDAAASVTTAVCTL